MEKPKKPVEPNWNDFPTPKEPNAKNYLGHPLHVKTEYHQAYDKWRKDMEKYNKDMEIYEQLKLIRLVKNSTEKYCLNKLKITRK